MPEYNGVYHQAIHASPDATFPYYVAYRKRLGEYVAYLINALDSHGILDSTVVLESTDMGHANDHAALDVPFIIAGGGSALNRGVVTNAGASYETADLLHTAAQALNVTLPYGSTIPGVLA